MTFFPRLCFSLCALAGLLEEGVLKRFTSQSGSQGHRTRQTTPHSAAEEGRSLSPGDSDVAK